MSTKRKLCLGPPQPAKKERKAINLDTKMMVIKQYEGGKKVNVIARDMKLSHSTVSTILKDKERICEAVKGSAPMRSTVITKQRTGPIHEMEKLLHIWMEDQFKKQTPLSFFTVQTKARSLFQTLKECAGEDYRQEFLASTGWFKRFKKRFQLHNVQVTGEAVNTYAEEAHKFINSKGEIIMDEDLSLDCQMEDIKEILDRESGEFLNEKMIKLEGVAEKGKIEGKMSERIFTTKGLSEGFSLLNKLLAHFEAMDPNIERFARIEQSAHDTFFPYREIYDKKKQTIEAKLSMFMKRVTPPASPRTTLTDDEEMDNPQPSTSDENIGQTRFEDQSSSEQRVNCVQHAERLRKESCTPVKSCELKNKQLGIEPPLGNLEPKEEITDLIEIKVEEEDLCTSLDDEVSNTPTIDPLEVISSTCFSGTDQLKVDCSDSKSISERKKMKMDHQMASHKQTSEVVEDPPQHTQTAKMVGQLLATLSPTAQLQMTAEVTQFIVERLPRYKET